MAKISGVAICLLVALRLATGWHFFHEGMAKLEPGFSSEGFLRQAKGPLAPLYQGVLKGPHRANELLVPADANADAIDYHPWVEQIEHDWRLSLERLGRLVKDDETMVRVRSATDRRLAEIERLLGEQKSPFGTIAYERSRESRLLEQTPIDPPPYQQQRLADKRREIRQALLGVTDIVAGQEQAWVEETVALTDGVASPGRVRAALAERSPLRRVDRLVTVVVLGVGVALFLGALTPVAGLVGAGFLLAVLATQPPWVAGAATDNLFYVLVEAMALLVLAATSAGRWAGLDGVAAGSCSRRAA